MHAPPQDDSPSPPRRVYLDHHATTPLDPRVLEIMLPYLGPKFGNAASRTHSFGWEAEEAVRDARRKVAALIGAAAGEIVFTSGASDANQYALMGALAGGNGPRGHVVTAATEHLSVLDTVERVERWGCRATVLRPEADGILDPARVAAAIEDDTVLVSVMFANNETGVLQPVREIGALCRRRGVLFHCDAVQAVGKIPVDASRDSIDLMSISAHKIYGPKGAGALYVRRRVAIAPQGHAGTLNVPAIAGFGEACAIAADEMAGESARLTRLRDGLLARLQAELDGVEPNGSMVQRLPGNLNVSFAGVDHGKLLACLPEIAVSTGSACTSAMLRPSHVLSAMGLPTARIGSAVRIGLGRFNTADEVDYAAGRIIAAVQNLRSASAGLPGRAAARPA